MKVKQRSLRDRLRSCRSRGNLTTSDLARWLKRPRATVHTWVEHGAEPSGPDGDRLDLFQRVTALEKAVAVHPAFPLRQLSPSERIARIEALRPR